MLLRNCGGSNVKSLWVCALTTDTRYAKQGMGKSSLWSPAPSQSSASFQPVNSKAVSKLALICSSYLSPAQLWFPSPSSSPPPPQAVRIFSLHCKFSKSKGNGKVFTGKIGEVPLGLAGKPLRGRVPEAHDLSSQNRFSLLVEVVFCFC